MILTLLKLDVLEIPKLILFIKVVAYWLKLLLLKHKFEVDFGDDD